MKKAYFAFCLLIFLSSVFSSEIEVKDGDEAYAIYQSLPGVICTEWNSKDSVVYTKYQTAKCTDQNEASEWTCTIQINKKDQRKNSFISASCTREKN